MEDNKIIIILLCVIIAILVVGVVVLMELAGLKGREKIAGYRLDAAIRYEGK